MSVKENIRSLRKRAKMTQRELAEKMGISEVGVHQWETGKRTPTIKTCGRIADALGVTIGELIGHDVTESVSVSEHDFLMSYAKEAFFDEEICRDLLRVLWTAYCLHKNLDVNSSMYASELLKVWCKVVEGSEGSTADWSDFRSFDTFMRRYLA